MARGLPAFLGVDRRRCCRSVDWLGFRPLAVDLALGAYRVCPGRLHRRCGQSGEIGGRGSGQKRPSRLKPDGLNCRTPAWPAIPRDATRMIDPIEQFHIHKIFTIGHIGNQEIAFTNFVGLHARLGGADFVADDWRGKQAGSRPFPVDRGDQLRVCRQYHPIDGRQGRHEVLPAGVLVVHVRRRVEHRGSDPLQLHDSPATSSSRPRSRCSCS